ncbi:MAG: N-acetylmuramoyl-L-alanine amidase-like domain-containing protein [Thermodesulfobacteriota bacterium]|tara:strand:+ start:22635 stop:23444 length:810 start_codon:yes stop_codon:yes gene_type:complete
MKYKKERKFNSFILIIFLILSSPFYSFSETFYSDELKSQYYKTEVDKLILSRPNSISKRYEYYSSAFLGRPYKSNTLSGDLKNKEVLILNLKEMDCFTYLDYVHSLINAENYYDFINQLKEVRYKDGIVSFKNRNHFFYDWAKNIKNIDDITDEIFLGKSIKVSKNLNLKSDGKLFLNGIDIRKVSIVYLEPKFINNQNINLLESGDYVGIYSPIDGLDVSHVGIFIKKAGTYLFRHASSVSGVNKVVDVNFLEYIKNKPGIIIYRNKI